MSSAQDHTADHITDQAQNDHARDDHNGHEDGFAHGTRRDYVIGFVLSVILTVIPFGLVMSGGVGSDRTTVLLVLVCAVVQMVVHMIYFLHMSPRVQNGWTMISLAFTMVLLIIAVSGTMWVMYNMDANMMPDQIEHEAPGGRAMP